MLMEYLEAWTSTLLGMNEGYSYHYWNIQPTCKEAKLEEIQHIYVYIRTCSSDQSELTLMRLWLAVKMRQDLLQ